IEIRNCTTYEMRTVGTNTANYQNVFNGGGVVTYSTAGNGVFLNYGTNHWIFNGTKISSQATSSTGTGMDLEGWGMACIGCAVQGWSIGLVYGDTSSGSTVPHSGLEISGGYYENNSVSHIRIGYAGQATSNAAGVSIHGAYFNGSNSSGTATTQGCIDLQWADGFSISGNEFYNCLTYIVRALADGTNQGADNGIVGPNTVTSGSAAYALLGKNITFLTPACVSGASPAACGYVSSGQVALPAGGFNLVVNDPFVTANSRIFINEDMTIGN